MAMANPLDQSEFEQLPDLYQRWVEELLPDGIPRERNATCLECAMCSPQGLDFDREMGYYDVTLKCCTFFPDLPNFLVGRAIVGDNPGVAALRAFIDSSDGRGVATMRAVKPNAKIATIYDHHNKTGFGRDPDLLCPYAIDKDGPSGPFCGIWQQRNSVCATFFCKHEKGRTGSRFWQTLRGLLAQLEWSLSWWAITQLINDPVRVYTAGANQSGGANGISLRAGAWDYWEGTRIAFYESCAALVEGLSAEEALGIAGTDARLYHQELLQRFQALRSGDIPEHLRAAPFNISRSDSQRTTLQALTSSQPVEVPTLLVSLIRQFDGRSTGATLEAIRAESRVRLDAKLVRRLYDFGILEKASGGSHGEG